MALKLKSWILVVFILTFLINLSFVKAIVPYWIEDTNGDGTADYVWIKVNLTTGDNTFFYNLEPGYSPNGDQVFDFFDDFETWNGWVKYSSGIISQDCSVKFQGSCSLRKSTNGDPNGGYKNIGFTLNYPFILEANIKRTSNTGSNWDRFGIIDNSGNGYGFAYGNDVPAIGVDKRTSYSGTTSYYTSSWTVFNQWYFAQFIWKGNGNMVSKIYDLNGNLKDSYTYSDNSYNSFTRVYVFGGYTYYVDNLRIRKYTSTEPTVSVSGTKITINSPTTLTDYQVKIPASDLGITSLTESINFNATLSFSLTLENTEVKELDNDTITYKLNWFALDKNLDNATGYAVIHDLTGNHTVNLTFNGTHLIANESHIWDLVNQSEINLSSYDTRTIFVNVTLFWNDSTNNTIEQNNTKKIYQRFNISSIKYKAYYIEDQDGIFNITYSFALTTPNLPYLTDYDLVYISYNDTELSTTATADIPQNSLARKISTTYYYVPRPDGNPDINVTKTTNYGGNNYYEAILQINFSNKQANMLPNTYYITINPTFNLTYNNFTIERYKSDEIIITTPDIKESDFYSQTYYYNGQTYSSSASSLGILWSDLLINYYLFDWNQVQIKATFKPEEISTSGMDTISYDFWLGYDFKEKTNDNAYLYFTDNITYNYSTTGGSTTPNTQINLVNEGRLFDEFTADWSYVKYYAYQSSATVNKSYVRFYYLPPTCLNMSSTINLNLYYIGNENTLEPVNLVRLNIYVKDGSTQDPVPDAVVKVLKETSPGTYTLVEQLKTDTQGKANALVQAYDYNYKFIVEKDCQVLYTTSPTTISTSDIIIYVSQGGGDVSLTQYYQDYMSSIAYNFSYDPNTEILTATYSDTSGISREHCFELQYINVDGEYTTQSRDCFTTASTTKDYNLSNTVYEKWRIRYYIDGTLIDTYTFDKGVYDRLKENYNPFAVFMLILVFAILTLVFGLMELFFFALPLILYASYYLGFLYLSNTYLLTITLLSWIFAIASLFKKEGLV